MRISERINEIVKTASTLEEGAQLALEAIVEETATSNRHRPPHPAGRPDAGVAGGKEHPRRRA